MDKTCYVVTRYIPDSFTPEAHTITNIKSLSAVIEDFLSIQEVTHVSVRLETKKEETDRLDINNIIKYHR